MKGTRSVKEGLQRLFASQRLTVLATQDKGQPYTNLVAFASSEDLRHLYFATNRSTRKFANISGDPRVSLLVDNRSNESPDFRKATAVTATGRAAELGGSGRDAALKIYLDKHPYLEAFVASPGCALLRVEVDTYYVVTRFQEVMEVRVDQ